MSEPKVYPLRHGVVVSVYGEHEVFTPFCQWCGFTLESIYQEHFCCSLGTRVVPA